MFNVKFLKMFFMNIFNPLKYCVYGILVFSLYLTVSCSLGLWFSSNEQSYIAYSVIFLVLEVFLTIIFFVTKEEYDSGRFK